MTRFFYTLLLYVLAPGLWLWMRLRVGKRAGIWEILAPARFGRYGLQDIKFGAQNSVWVHAVSLGEIRAAQPLIAALLKQGFPILLTHTTPTGRDAGSGLFAEAITNGQLRQMWLPYDFPWVQRRFFKTFQPRCGILIEREVWPNLIYEARCAKVPVLLVNARLAPASVRYSRWLGPALRQAYASLALVLTQTQADADRLQQVGVSDPRVVGNLKFDVVLATHKLVAGREWRQALRRPVVAIASTREGEEDMFLREIQQTLRAPKSTVFAPSSAPSPDRSRRGAPDDVLHVLIPRHPQRFNTVTSLLKKYDIAFIRRSVDVFLPAQEIAVLLGDTLGEMAFYYAAADVAIIGGGFSPHGGQNLIEACAFGTPVIIGPHMFNFEQASQDAVAAGAAIRVKDAADALQEAYALLNDRPRREAMSAAALGWTKAHQGATQRTLDALRPWLS
jgi:3-deoxy-D-manno-octulosonic-acid transferase